MSFNLITELVMICFGQFGQMKSETENRKESKLEVFCIDYAWVDIINLLEYFNVF